MALINRLAMMNCCQDNNLILKSKTGPDALMENISKRLTIAKARIVILHLLSAMGAPILCTNKTMLSPVNYAK